MLGADVEDGGELQALTEVHSGFVADHPDWRERVEVGYISYAVTEWINWQVGPLPVAFLVLVAMAVAC